MDCRSQGGPRKPFCQTVLPAGQSLASRPSSSRPLSDIREITEPSLFEGIHRKPIGEAPRRRGGYQPEAARRDRDGHNSRASSRQRTRSPLKSPDNSHPDRSSIYSIPLEVVPPRSSSKPATTHKRSTSIPRAPAVLVGQPSAQYYCVRNQGQSASPIRDAVNCIGAPDPEQTERIPSKTIVKKESPCLTDLLDHPTHLHPRLKVDLLVAAPLFVGGSSVEGSLRIIVDEAERVRHRKTLTLERVAIDLLGIEEVSGPRRNIFLALGNELVDMTHPPPNALVESQRTLTPLERLWILVPSVATLPFLLTLPLEVGPPPFQSKHARIRYMLCATVTIRDAGRQLCVRNSQEISILSVYDPEKALVSLPSPLTASEEYLVTRGRGTERVTVTAGLHRQVWVSGTSIFADVHIVNESRKNVKRLELQLERYVLSYKHAAASTLEASASQARIFSQSERDIFARSVVKAGTHGWNGVMPQSSVLRTCDLEIPRGHATIKCNKYFEVRYYLRVVVSSSHTKLVTIQLPLVLIHMNSLDVPTNSVAQVAAAIEEKRGTRMSPKPASSPQLRRVPSRNLQGRAFAAPRMHSLDRARQYHENLNEVREMLDSSPRKYSPSKVIRKAASTFGFKTPPSNRKGRVIQEDDADEIRKCLGHLRTVGSTLTSRSIPTNTLSNNSTQARASSALGFVSTTRPAEDTENPPPVPPKEHSSGRQTRKQASVESWYKQGLHDRERAAWQLEKDRDMRKDKPMERRRDRDRFVELSGTLSRMI